MTQSIGQKFTPVSLLRFAFPSVVMMVFMSLYSIVDGIFISRLVGSGALSAANIVFPAASLLIALGVMLATGGSALVAKELGEGNKRQAKEDFTFLVAVGVLISLLFLVITALFSRQIVYLLGSNDNLAEYCMDYLKILMYFAPASMLQMMFQTFFVTAGRPHLGLGLTVMAGIVNAVLDYIFMGITGMGIKGAALATGLGQLIPAVVGVLWFTAGKGDLHFVRFHVDFHKLGQACFNGASEMVTNISNAVITYLFNIILMQMAGEDGVAAISIILYGQFLFNSFYMGFCMGTAPVISFKYGEKKEDELGSVTAICRYFVLISSVVIALLAFATSDLVTTVFVPRGSAVHDMTVHGFLIFSISYLFSGYNIFISSYFTALSDGKTSAVVSFTRTFGCILAALLILPRILGITGVWLAIPVAEFVTAGLCIWLQHRKKQ